MKTYIKLLFAAAAISMTTALRAQEYSGITGLFQVPSAEMAPEGTARIGVYYMSKEFIPDKITFNGERFNTTNHFLGITPFSWIEISYICTLLKAYKNNDDSQKSGYYMKDRHFSVKIRPLKEGKWWPAIALGYQDPGRTVEDKGGEAAYFSNYYAVATKHIPCWGSELGVTVAYRHYRGSMNEKWNGIAGGLSFRPAFAKDLRALVEYTGDDVNVAVDYLLLKHFFLQAGLQDGKHFTGGVCCHINLF